MEHNNENSYVEDISMTMKPLMDAPNNIMGEEYGTN